MTLEIPTPKTPGEEIRRTEAPAPAVAGGMILGLTGIILLFMVLIFAAVYDIGDSGMPELATLRADAHDPAIKDHIGSFDVFKNEQVIVSFWLACVFFSLFFVILLYQRYFMDHVTIAKRRFRKWEDEGVQLR